MTSARLGRHRRNFWVLALHHIVVRTGWVFKTETVIMPGFLDALGAGAAVRGCLPVLGRLGQSLPQFLVAGQVRRLREQKGALCAVTLVSGLPWLLLSLMVWGWPGLQAHWQIVAFLTLYTLFYIAFGNWLLLTGTIQGKLIAVERRGRLLAVSQFAGCGLAALAAAVWLGRWLERGLSGYATIFGAVAAGFFLGGLLATIFDEPPAASVGGQPGLGPFVREALQAASRDRNFRRLLAVVGLYQTVLILFPHYAVFGLRKLDVGVDAFVLWVVVQNVTNGTGSALAGSLADRCGNRVVLLLLLCLGATTPLLAVGLGQAGLPWGRRLFWLVFVLLGFTPVTQRILTNYALEISPSSQHALYLGMLNLTRGLPLLLAPLFGWIIDATSFQFVFLLGCLAILASGATAVGLIEPRSTVSPKPPVAESPGGTAP